ncbi:hypothetical protein GF402_11105 [Candidatus Fermentibacteria bacterium]|nr:hypothetical protein [Candidatus Fermentibacteria bacterium]
MMSCVLVLLAVLEGFDVGPTLGALVPIQEDDDPWRVSFLLGIRGVYQLPVFDLEGDFQLSPLQIDPDSSQGYDYSLVALTAGIRKDAIGLSFSGGPALYHVEARKDLGEGLESYWEGSFGGMYVQLGKCFGVNPLLFDLSCRFNVINFEGVWTGLSLSALI